MAPTNKRAGYDCWLDYREIEDDKLRSEYRKWCSNIVVMGNSAMMNSALQEIRLGIRTMLGIRPVVSETPQKNYFVVLGVFGTNSLIDIYLQEEEKQKIGEEGYIIKVIAGDERSYIIISGRTDKGVLYGTYSLLRLLQMQTGIDNLNRIENPCNLLRIINHWDNMDGSVERGYAGRSIFYDQHKFSKNMSRIKDYARLLSSIGINGLVLNNVNVKESAIRLISADSLTSVAKLADIFSSYGIKIYLCINYAAPILLGNLSTADPLDPAVREWWREKVAEIYRYIPDFGGFLVKADSEHTPGPFTYGRNHAEGANVLAEALKPFNGLVIWRCFVYNCTQDWRDQAIDRAKAAYDNFKPLDGEFCDNVVLQIKNGPVDFQVREPVSPLFGGLEKTNQMIELQITQEYTGQQRHLCYLVPHWKEVLDFNTYAKGEGPAVQKVVDGSTFGRPFSGFAGVSNIGDDLNWTGHDLAQANLYGFGRLAWEPDLSAAEIVEEWVRLTFRNDRRIIETISEMLLNSWRIYESYTAPLGIGWMVNPGYHYGPNVDGYEYSKWGTYHRADCLGIGIDRTVKTGTGYAGQYHAPNALKYESLETCPDELLLFFHHVPYLHRLKSGETVIQHIYNTHFDGVDQVAELREKWLSLQNLVIDERFERVLKRLDEQLEHAREWRDVINSYFFRKSGIPDQLGRKIY